MSSASPSIGYATAIAAFFMKKETIQFSWMSRLNLGCWRIILVHQPSVWITNWERKVDLFLAKASRHQTTNRFIRMKNLSVPCTVAAVAAVLVLTSMTSVNGFSAISSQTATARNDIGLFGGSGTSSLFSDRVSYDSVTSLQSTADSTSEDIYAKKKKTLKELRAEGGITTVNTPIGALNLFALYYFFVSVALGIPWVILCKCWQIVHWLSRGRFDPRVRFAKLIATKENRGWMRQCSVVFRKHCFFIPWKCQNSFVQWKSRDFPFFTDLTSNKFRSLCMLMLCIPTIRSVESLYL